MVVSFAFGDPLGYLADDEDHPLGVPVDGQTHGRLDPTPAPVGMTQAVLRHVLSTLTAQTGKRRGAERDVVGMRDVRQ